MDEHANSCSSLEEIAFKWMFHCGILETLHEQCKQYNNQISDKKMRERMIYRIILAIDVGELLNDDVQLGNVALKQPKKAKEIFQEACFICVQTLNWIPEIRTKTQIDLQMRYLSVPHFISCSSVFALRRELSKSGEESMPLFSTTGVVCGMTSRMNYTQSTWFQCINNECCSFSDGNECAGYSNEAQGENLSGDMICINCGTPLEEDISCRVLGEKCLLHIVCPDGFSNSTSMKCRFHRSVSVYVRDELINEVKLGSCYSFSLIPYREAHVGQNSNQLNLVFEANNVTKVAAYPILSTTPQSFLKTNSKFGLIQRLYEDRKSSSWSFAACLAYFFGAFRMIKALRNLQTCDLILLWNNEPITKTCRKGFTKNQEDQIFVSLLAVAVLQWLTARVVAEDITDSNNDWQLTRLTLLERRSFMFNNSLMSDVEFISKGRSADE